METARRAFVVSALCAAWLLGARPAAAEVRVCPDCSVRSLTEAVAAAALGETIRVGPGVYHESGIVIDRPLRVIGEGRPVIDGGGKGSVLVVRAPKVELSGLAVRNSGVSYLDDFSAIEVERGDGCVLRDNQLTDNFFAIHLANTSDCTIEGNVILGADRPLNSAGNGIHVWRGRDVRVLDNRVSRQRDGIYFEFVTDSTVAGNRSERNLRYGLHFMYSHGNAYRKNLFRSNNAGVAVMYSRNVVMEDNRFERNWGAASYGLLLKEISASTVRRNVFEKNTTGIHVEGTTRTLFEENELRDNGYALRIMGDADSNRFTRNDFIGDTFDVATGAGEDHNEFSENYWSDYDGLDLDRDGIGDTPFQPVRLSSVFMARLGASVLLLRSFFFAVADSAERLLPALSPGAVHDDRPLMKPVSKPARSLALSLVTP